MTGAPSRLHVITCRAKREGDGLLLSDSLDNKGQNFPEVPCATGQNGHTPVLSQSLAKEERVAVIVVAQPCSGAGGGVTFPEHVGAPI